MNYTRTGNAFDLFSSHQPALIAAALQTQGKILELGMGLYSTPLLHVIAEEQERILLSVENDEKWASEFYYLKSKWHEFYSDEDFRHCRDMEYGLVFVDSWPDEGRAKYIEQFKDSAQMIVVHDSEDMRYGYEEIFKGFKYRHDYKQYPVYTTVVSNFKEFKM